jgi:hypothetical protein
MSQSSATTDDTPLSSLAIATLLSPPSTRTADMVRKLAGIALSLAILAAVAIRTQGVDFSRIMSVAPGLSPFWPIFLLTYFLMPVAHWTMYRRLWRLPAAGIVPLLRMQVANEIVLGYSGEAHFYFWARQHAGLTGSPFGAIKDVSVISAVAGNLATLFMMVLMAPSLATIMTGPFADTFRWSIAIIVVFSLLPFVFRRQLFSLPGPALRGIMATHFARMALWLMLSAAMWHFLLPGIAVGIWLSLATLRLMISRLPLVANKDILFAAATMLLLGKSADASAAIAFTASLTLVAHLIVGAGAEIAGFVGRRRMA